MEIIHLEKFFRQRPKCWLIGSEFAPISHCYAMSFCFQPVQLRIGMFCRHELQCAMSYAQCYNLICDQEVTRKSHETFLYANSQLLTRLKNQT